MLSHRLVLTCQARLASTADAAVPLGFPAEHFQYVQNTQRRTLSSCQQRLSLSVSVSHTQRDGIHLRRPILCTLSYPDGSQMERVPNVHVPRRSTLSNGDPPNGAICGRYAAYLVLDGAPSRSR